MMYEQWQEVELLSEQIFEELTRFDVESKTTLLSTPVRKLKYTSFIGCKPTTSLDSLLSELEESEVSCAIIQESADVILGVIPKCYVETIGKKARRLPVSQFMERSLCVELETATIGELLTRSVVGKHRYYILVDRRGQVSGIASSRVILAEAVRLLKSE